MNDKLINVSLHDEKWMESLAITIFEDIAELIQKKFGGVVKNIEFPKNLKDNYQFYTKSSDSWDGYRFTKIEEYLDSIV